MPLLLLALLEGEELHGYQIMQALKERTGGGYSPSAGSVYPRLHRLQREGLVTSREEGVRVLYRLTEPGRIALAERQEELQEVSAELQRSSVRQSQALREELRRSADGLRQELIGQAEELRRGTGAGGPQAAELQAALRRISAEWARTAPRDVSRERARELLSALVEAALRTLHELVEG